MKKEKYDLSAPNTDKPVWLSDLVNKQTGEISEFTLPSDGEITKRANELYPTCIECQRGYVQGSIWMRKQRIKNRL
jgi:hypothetical protein